MLGRLSRAQGEAELAQKVQEQLWETGFRPPDLALDLARHEQDHNRLARSRHFLQSAFGDSPDDPQARILLARALAGVNHAAALRLLDGIALEAPGDALMAVDVLRNADQLSGAAALVEQALLDFPSDNRFLVRKARIVEALGQWTDALAIWQDLDRQGDGTDIVAIYELARLNLKLEHRSDAMRAAARHMTAPATLPERLKLALLLDQPGMVQDLIMDAAARQGSPEPVSDDNWARVARTLLNHGMIGLAAYLAGNNLPVGDRITELLTSVLGTKSLRSIARQTISTAQKTTSPECLLPFGSTAVFDAYNSLRDAPTGEADSDAYLLVNATLSAGGAERQFVVMVEAMLANGIAPARIHVALFSLVEDRGHQHFLPQLQALGVHIHDLRALRDQPINLPAALAPVINTLPARLREDFGALWRVAAKLNPRVLHGWQDRGSLTAGLVGLCLKTPRIVMSLRNMQPQKRGDFPRYTQALFQEFAQHPRVSINANSQAGARDYQDWLALEHGRITTLHNGLDTKGCRAVAKASAPIQWPRLDDPDTVLTVGGVFRLAANKRPLLWLETIAELSRLSRCQIVPRLVGSGPFLARVQSLATDLGLHDLQIENALSSPAEIYGRMDCLLLMSRVEGTPNVLLEAQACGLPVAACDVGGVTEAVWADGPGEALVLNPDINARAAAQRIHAWLPDGLQHGRTQRQDFVEARYGMASYCKMIRTIHEETHENSAETGHWI